MAGPEARSAVLAPEIPASHASPQTGNPLSRGARRRRAAKDGRTLIPGPPPFEGPVNFFRLHGTGEPETIGHAVSSGSIRPFNRDIIGLYDRVPLGTHVTVVQR